MWTADSRNGGWQGCCGRCPIPLHVLAMLLALMPFMLPPQAALALPYEVIHGEEIRRSGFTRVGELFLLTEGWRSYTVDHFHFTPVAPGRSPGSAGDLTVLIDGHRIHFAFPASGNLNLLPLTVAQIDSVEFIRAPDPRAAIYNAEALIHFHSAAPDSGIAAHVHAWFANESGDPGPYIFTEFSSPNVDRTGPEYLYAVSWAGEAGEVSAGMFDQNHYATDAAIIYRNPEKNNSDLWLQAATPFLRARLELFNFDHHILVSRSSTSDILIGGGKSAGPVYLEMLGAEVQAQESNLTASLHGRLKQNGRARVGYRVSGTRQVFGNHPNGNGQPPVDWRADRMEAGIDGAATLGAVDAGARALFTRLDLHSGPAFSDDLNCIDLSLSLASNRQEGRSWQCVLHAGSLGRKLYPGLSGQVKLPLAGKNVLRLLGSVHTRQAFGEQSPWFWQARGIQMPEPAEQNLFITETAGNHHTASLSMEFRRSAFFTAGITWWRVRGGGFVQYMYDFDEGTRQLLPEVSVTSGAHYQSLNLNFSLARRTGPLDHRISYGYVQQFHSAESIKRLEPDLPRHKASYVSHLRLAPSFSLSVYAAYFSSAVWPGFEAAEAATNGFYSQGIPSMGIVNLSLEKYLWERRIWTRVAVRNLFNERVQSYPGGGRADLQLHFQIRLRLGFSH